MTQTIAVDQLRVGMFIHLDGGWLSHPFPLSDFRISSSEEILTLRRLGLTQVRWRPERSDSTAAAVPEEPAAAQAATASGAPTVEAPVAVERRAWLAAQRAAAQRCERQYGEAALCWREAADSVASDPLRAGGLSAALADAMLEKMLMADDVAIRMVTACRDRAAAHALNVTVISMLIGRTLGMEDGDLRDLGVGALLHDIGKQDLPDRLRHAGDAMSAVEIGLYREHVTRGLAHGRRMALAAGAQAVIGEHHEYADGSGFPQRLSADRMALGSRIVAIVNRYDNLCNPAAPALAVTPHEAVAMLFAQGRARFDPPVLNAFIRMMGVYPAGSLVQLTDDRYAMVVGVNSSRPLKPRVLVHGAAPRGGGAGSATDAQLIDLEDLADLGIRRSLAPGKLPPSALAALDPRPRVAYYFEPLDRGPADDAPGRPRARDDTRGAGQGLAR